MRERVRVRVSEREGGGKKSVVSIFSTTLGILFTGPNFSRF